MKVGVRRKEADKEKKTIRNQFVIQRSGRRKNLRRRNTERDRSKHNSLTKLSEWLIWNPESRQHGIPKMSGHKSSCSLLVELQHDSCFGTVRELPENFSGLCFWEEMPEKNATFKRKDLFSLTVWGQPRAKVMATGTQVADHTVPAVRTWRDKYWC